MDNLPVGMGDATEVVLEKLPVTFNEQISTDYDTLEHSLDNRHSLSAHYAQRNKQPTVREGAKLNFESINDHVFFQVHLPPWVIHMWRHDGTRCYISVNRITRGM